jgi:hypothetical protein
MQRFFFLALLCSASLKADVLLTDSFDGTGLDSSKWDVLLPFGNSSISVQNGILSSVNSGKILPKTSFTGPITISGTFNLKSRSSVFQVALRSDGQVPANNPYGVLSGIQIGFLNDDTTGTGNQSSLIWVQEWGSNYERSVVKNYLTPVGLNVFENFSIVDDGYQISVFLNGVQVISTSTNYTQGSRIAFAGRESLAGISQTDIGELQIIPEPSSLSLLMLGALGLASRRLLKRSS